MTLNPETRHSLLESIRDPQDRMAWDEFVKIYEPVIYRLLRNAQVQDADARDLTQDIFVKIHHHVGSWKIGAAYGSFSGWLRRVVRNQMVSWWRERQRDLSKQTLWDPGLLDSSMLSASGLCNEFDRELGRSVFRHAASKVQDEFESRTWQAFWMTTVQDQEITTAAAALGMSSGAVRVAKCRVIARLKAVIEELRNEY